MMKDFLVMILDVLNMIEDKILMNFISTLEDIFNINYGYEIDVSTDLFTPVG